MLNHSFSFSFSSISPGPAAMERSTFDLYEDVSATMMRRARCLHAARYSTDAGSNLQLISTEVQSYQKKLHNKKHDNELGMMIASREQVFRLWSWIDRVEKLCVRSDFDSVIDERRLPARGLIDAGVLKLLRMDVVDSDEVTTFDKSSMSLLFNRNIFDSPMRR